MNLVDKYRPLSFKEVCGHRSAVSVLATQTANGQVAGSYLLTGARESGKITVARIFAAMNCAKLDISEYDGYQLTINDVRQLCAKAQLPPLAGDYKFVIVEDADGIRGAPLDAMLKLVEEPPEHLVILLTSSRLGSIPDTILSRCQHLLFAPVEEAEIAQRLEKICECERLRFDRGALEVFAAKSGGAFGRALRMFDEAAMIAEANKIILSAEIAEKISSSPIRSYARDFLQACIRMNYPDALVASSSALVQVDCEVFLRELAALCHDLLIVGFDGARFPSLTKLEVKEVKDLRQAMDEALASMSERLLRWIRQLESAIKLSRLFPVKEHQLILDFLFTRFIDDLL